MKKKNYFSLELHKRISKLMKNDFITGESRILKNDNTSTSGELILLKTVTHTITPLYLNTTYYRRALVV